MRSEEVLALLEELGAIETGHFVLSSGMHSSTYVQKFRALEVPSVAKELGSRLAALVTDELLDGRHVDVVLSPAVGGMLLGFMTAAALGARFIFAEREGAGFKLRRGFAVEEGEGVLVVDDVTTTGGSVREVIPLISPGEGLGIGLLMDRSEGADLGLPAVALATLNVPNFNPEDCPLCADDVPMTTPGSRHIASDQRK